MSSVCIRALAAASVLLAVASLAAPTPAQTLYGSDGLGTVLEFDLGPGLGCPPPVPFVAAWPYLVPGPCLPPGPMLLPSGAPPGAVLGDVATDRLTDIVYVTDGVILGEFAAGAPGVPPGMPLNTSPIPPLPLPAGGVMGPITGMGMDGTGAVTGGLPTLWVTDGVSIAGLTPGGPPGTCAPMLIVVPPFAHGLGAAVFLTDVTWDPVTGTLWGCDAGAAAGIANIVVGGGLGPGGFIPAGICGPLAGPLQGIAYDLASPGAPLLLNNAPAPAAYVTDGFVVQYIDLTTGLPAAPTFYTAAPCIPTPAPINGLAFASHGVAWGPAGGLTAATYGQSSAPGPTFGVTISGGTPGANAWVIFGVNTPASPTMGFFCPGLPALGPGIALYADLFTPPGSVVFLGVFPAAGTIVLPSPIGPVPPPGVEIYAQFLEDVSTVGLGPWGMSNPLLITTTAP